VLGTALIPGVVVTTKLGISATIFYLMVYVVMNLAAFAVIVARERETEWGDDIAGLYGLGADRPWLAWPQPAPVPLPLARALQGDGRRGGRRVLRVPLGGKGGGGLFGCSLLGRPGR